MPGSYLFSDIAKKLIRSKLHLSKDIIRLGVGDVTRPLPQASIEAMHWEAVEELTNKGTFRGYGPEQGYDFLIDAIIKTISLERNTP